MPAQDFSGQLEPRPVWDLIQYRMVAIFQFPWTVSFCIISSSIMLTPGNHHRNNGPAQWTRHFREEAGNLKKMFCSCQRSDFFDLFIENVGKNFLLNPQWNRVLLQIPNDPLSTNLLETAKQRGRLEATTLAGLTRVHTGKGKEFTTLLYSQYYTDFFLFVLYNFVSFWAMLCLYLCRTSSYRIKQ